ncbi:MAG TPA: DUF1697 domain-containing protein [Gemmatimonadales bacterium]|nr:DUF1697 domain-containing protein [Gemmatimonadales bacterium]
MKAYVAFLRAINVGGHVVTMDRLRHLFGELGLDGVATFIASGNVVFRTGARNTAALERRIAPHLEDALGYRAPVRQRVASMSTADDRFRVHRREVYWLRNGAFRDSPFSGAALEKVLGGPATLRNMNTVRKLALKFPA